MEGMTAGWMGQRDGTGRTLNLGRDDKKGPAVQRWKSEEAAQAQGAASAEAPGVETQVPGVALRPW